MRIVDSHCHVSSVWYEPVESLLFQMDRCGVERAVLVQLLGQYDNAYQQSCLRRHPDRFASVVGIDPAREDAAQRLQELAEQGATGVRLRPEARSAGADPLAIWRVSDRLGLAVSCVGNVTKFSAPEFRDVVGAFPRLTIVLEHLGGSSAPDATEAEAAARRRVFELARFPNVCLKMPGLGELATRSSILPRHEAMPLEMPGMLFQALEFFGAERLMWGSDFPVVSSREGYANALGWCRHALADQPESVMSQIFGGTAARVFRRGGGSLS